MPPRPRKTTSATTADPPPSETTGTGTDPQAGDQRKDGFNVGDRAPSGKFAPLGPDGQPDLSKVSSKPVEGYGVQLVGKGDTITEAVYASLNPPEVPAEPEA